MGYPMFISVFDTPIIGTDSPKYYAVLTRHTMAITSPNSSSFTALVPPTFGNSDGVT